MTKSTSQISILVASLAFLSACSSDKHKAVEVDQIRFATTDASELFFKNVRKSEYIIEDLPAAGMEVYRPEQEPGEFELLSPALIVNWKNDNAFLMLEKADSLPEELKIIVRSADEVDTLFFDGSQQRQHAEVAVAMYNAILKKEKVFLLTDQNELVAIFSEEEREKFRRIVFDFLRLVELR